MGLAKGGTTKGEIPQHPNSKSYTTQQHNKTKSCGKTLPLHPACSLPFVPSQICIASPKVQQIPHFKKLTNKGKKVLMNMMFNLLHQDLAPSAINLYKEKRHLLLLPQFLNHKHKSLCLPNGLQCCSRAIASAHGPVITLKKPSQCAQTHHQEDHC